jgi:hypothetical protein
LDSAATRQRPGEFDFVPALSRGQEKALELPAIGFLQLPAHIGVNQIRLSRLQRSEIRGIGERAILYANLLLFREVPSRYCCSNTSSARSARMCDATIHISLTNPANASQRVSAAL